MQFSYIHSSTQKLLLAVLRYVVPGIEHEIVQVPYTLSSNYGCFRMLIPEAVEISERVKYMVCRQGNQLSLTSYGTISIELRNSPRQLSVPPKIKQKYQ